jgi:8-oxo-dGTP pyrophosphatase MutT (NUDIX family)
MADSALQLPANVPSHLLDASILLPEWRKWMDPEFSVQAAVVHAFDIFPGPRIGFADLEVQCGFRGQIHSQRFLLSGYSVSMCVLVKCEGDPRLYTLMVEQPRIGCGKVTLEFPAGFLDDSLDFRAGAVRELEEECGISIQEQDLIDIGGMLGGAGQLFGVFPEQFGELLAAYVAIVKMSADEFSRFQGRTGGVDEDEQIVQRIIPFDDVLNCSSDCTTLSVAYSVRKLIRDGKIDIDV